MAEWQLPISFFDTYVFSEYFSLRSELLLNCVEKSCDGDFRRVCFFVFAEKNIVWWGSIIEKTFDSINEFLENRDQNSLDTRAFSAIFHSVPEVDNCVHNYKTWDANKSNLKEFPYRTVSFKYSLLPFFVSESNSSENSMRKAKSIKHFESMLMQFFTLFLWCFQCMT